MKIGFFDSGVGGLFTLKACQLLLPQYDYLFFGDSMHMPYGEKTSKEIVTYTFFGLHRLFDHGCTLCIIACNTAAAFSIRLRQKEFPEHKVLSVTIPLIENIIESGLQKPLIFCTQATKNAGIISDLFQRGGFDGLVDVISCPGLADRIEYASELLSKKIPLHQQEAILKEYIPNITNHDSIVLACTHFGICKDGFQKLLPGLTIFDTADIVPRKLSDYLHNHPEIEKILSRQGTLECFRNV